MVLIDHQLTQGGISLLTVVSGNQRSVEYSINFQSLSVDSQWLRRHLLYNPGEKNHPNPHPASSEIDSPGEV